jgi:cyclic dehypoxanthinyl futalosine synthase
MALMTTDIQPILDRALSGERLTVDDCTTLLESDDFVRIGLAADEVRKRFHPDGVVTYIIDRNINYTNVCNVVCTFCAFYRRPGHPETYVRTLDEIRQKIDETIALGGTGVLMQGGLHPDFRLEWYEDLLRTLSAEYPGFQLHCFSPPEIHNIHLISGLDYETIMARLKEAGLSSLPGGGGEILDDEVRKRVSTKCTTDEWLNVMRAAHRVGLRSTASSTACATSRASATFKTRRAASRPSSPGRFSARTRRSAGASRRSRPGLITSRCSRSRASSWTTSSTSSRRG